MDGRSFFTCIILCGLYAADDSLKDCSLHRNTSYTCGNIKTSQGYQLHVPDDVPHECLTQCENGWYYSDGTFLVDSNTPREKYSADIAYVTTRNLTTHRCLDGAYLKMDCHNPSKGKISYMKSENVKHVDEKNETSGSDKKELYWLLYLFIPVMVMAFIK